MQETEIEQAAELWKAAAELRAAAVGLIASSATDGVRLNAAKFLEQATLLLLAESPPSVSGGSAPGKSRLSLVLKCAQGGLSFHLR